MGVDRKLLTCRSCGASWAVEKSTGRYPQYCSKEVCQAIKRERQTLDPARWTLTAAETRPATEAPEKVREIRTQRDDERAELMQQIMHAELEAVATRADGRQAVGRTEMRSSVRTLAEATGIEPTYDALLELAADALAWATRIRPPALDYQPDMDRVGKIVDEVEDYGKLMVA